MLDQDDPAAPLPSPWDEVRAAQPGVILVRVIVDDKKLQFWIAIERSARNLENGAEVHDGLTVLLPRVPAPGRDLDDIKALIAAYDLSWHKNKKCHSTSPTPGARA